MRNIPLLLICVTFAGIVGSAMVVTAAESIRVLVGCLS